MATTGVWKPLVSEPMPDDSIVEAPSLVMPLLLKTKEIETNQPEEIQQGEDEVQIIGEQNSNAKNVDDYVKASYVAALTRKGYQDPILTIKDYYKSSAGYLLLDIGLRQVFECNLETSAKTLSRRLKRASDSEHTELTERLESIREDLSRYQHSNKPFKATSRFKCPKCRFSSEFKMVLERHLEEPHLSHKKEYLCNWCEFKTKSADQIIAHFLLGHKRRCRVVKPLSIHLCRFCPYETNAKRLMTSHILTCEIASALNNNPLGPKNFGENDLPAVTPKLITQEDIKAYERTRNALLLSSYNPNQINVTGFGVPRRVILVPRKYLPLNISLITCDTESAISESTLVCNPLQRFAKSRQNKRPRRENGVDNQTRLMQLMASQNQPSATHLPAILQYPNIQSSFVNGKSVLFSASGVIMAPAQQNSGTSGRVSDVSGKSNQLVNSGDHNMERSSSSDSQGGPAGSAANSKGNRTSASKKSHFIICEICDCYTKDLSDLRSHLVSIHEVKMHQKTLERRPPLSCQKCKWRFFTDQGLERHMLGVHSFVTSNLQSRVEQGKDSGRCTVCGKAFANNLVAHMKEMHKANLRLAQLSYKCTICTASFNLYSLFENHVLNVHPESVKRDTSVE